MNRAIKLFLTAIAAVMLIMAFAATSASAAQTVVFVASNGTGDGSSPDSPIGNAEGYKTEAGSDVKSALYRGLDKIKSTGGTLVIVGELIIDTSGSRVPTSPSDSYVPSEFKAPKFTSGKSLTITSVYNGVDYRKNGAKLIIDYDKCNTSTFFCPCATNISDLNIEYRYNPQNNNAWNTPFMLGGNGYSLTIGQNVNVTSFNTYKNTEGTVYPILLGGHRYSEVNKTNLTIRSGTWSTVIAGSFGLMDQTKVYGTVKGDATLYIEGGKIGAVYGTGSLRNPSSTVKGTLNITVTGGEIDEFYICHDYIFDGKNIIITLNQNAQITNFYYAPESYFGSLTALEKVVSIRNKSKVEIIPPSQAFQKPSDTDTPNESQNGDITPPNTVPDDKKQNIFEMLDDDTYKYIHPTVLKWVIIVCCVIALGFGAKYLLKMLRVK